MMALAPSWQTVSSSEFLLAPVVQTMQESVEVWPIKSRFIDPPEPQPRRKRRSGGANFTSPRNLHSNRERKGILRACQEWYNNYPPMNLVSE